MLSTPKNGWAEITMGGWSDRCSYVNDVPFELLEAFIRKYETHQMQAVEFDAEGWDYILVIGGYESYVIEEDGDVNDDTVSESNGIPTVHRIETTIDELVLELISDIRRDIDKWTGWLSYAVTTEDNLNKRKRKLLSLCNTLEEYVQKGQI